MLLKTKNIIEKSYKIGDSVKIKPSEDKDALIADVIDLHGKSIHIVYMCIHIIFSCGYAAM